MIHFTCHDCQSRLEASEARAGCSQECPTCDATVSIPDISNPNREIELSSAESTMVDEDAVADWLSDGMQPPATAATDATPKTKTCPFCAEAIQVAAIKCRYCGEFLTQSAADRYAASHFSNQPQQRIKDPGLAAALSFLTPGLGQIYNGQIVIGILAGLLCLILYITIILGLIMHIMLMYQAYNRATRINNGQA